MIVIDGQIARAIRGYVQIISALASRMVEFDLDADAQNSSNVCKPFVCNSLRIALLGLIVLGGAADSRSSNSNT